MEPDKLADEMKRQYDRCKGFPEQRHNPDGSVTIKGPAFLALIELRNRAPEAIDHLRALADLRRKA